MPVEPKWSELSTVHGLLADDVRTRPWVSNCAGEVFVAEGSETGVRIGHFQGDARLAAFAVAAHNLLLDSIEGGVGLMNGNACETSEIGLRVLNLAKGKDVGGVNWTDVTHVGATASTLKALVKGGLLRREEYPDGSKSWFITAAGEEVERASACG